MDPNSSVIKRLWCNRNMMIILLCVGQEQWVEVATGIKLLSLKSYCFVIMLICQ